MRACHDMSIIFHPYGPDRNIVQAAAISLLLFNFSILTIPYPSILVCDKTATISFTNQQYEIFLSFIQNAEVLFLALNRTDLRKNCNRKTRVSVEGLFT